MRDEHNREHKERVRDAHDLQTFVEFLETLTRIAFDFWFPEEDDETLQGVDPELAADLPESGAASVVSMASETTGDQEIAARRRAEHRWRGQHLSLSQDEPRVHFGTTKLLVILLT